MRIAISLGDRPTTWRSISTSRWSSGSAPSAERSARELVAASSTTPSTRTSPTGIWRRPRRWSIAALRATRVSQPANGVSRRLVVAHRAGELQEDVLGDVVGVVAVADDARDVAAHVVGIADVEVVQRAGVAGLGGGDRAVELLLRVHLGVPSSAVRLASVTEEGVHLP